MKSLGNVTGAAFSFEEMRDKLKREIDRLRAAEAVQDQSSAMDHALNAAFSGYHFLEWRAKTAIPPDARGAREILNAASNADLELLPGSASFAHSA